jgi:hypothetical protein
MRAIVFVSALVISAVAVQTAAPLPASACGGCFAPPEQITTVEAHRMVISLSLGRTTLWDQIEYTGNPADFVWVLPVPDPAATIEVAAPEFFVDLEAATSPVVTPLSPPPRLFCPRDDDDRGGGFGCGGGGAGSFSAAQDGGAPPDAGVTIFDQDTVGPYETVTIGSDSATALVDWLIAHEYNVPDITRPVIDYYVGLGSAFIALRLSPGVGVSAMQPVRVRYPGYMASFPLKMVTVGASGVLELLLWVVADQRFEAANYGNAQILGSELSWDWLNATSNYNQVFDQEIDALGGRAWVVEAVDRLTGIPFRGASAPDVDLAVVGIKYPIVTRLRTSMLVDHLTEDLELRPSADVGWVSTNLRAAINVNRPEDVVCEGDGAGSACKVGLGRRERGAIAGLVLFLMGVVALRKGRRRAT